MTIIRKAITLGVMVMMVLPLTLASVPRTALAAEAEVGDLIKQDGLSSVYYLGDDGKRYVFPNQNTYFSWYSDFSGVVTIPQAEMESYPIGGNVTIRPGTNLVKITTDPKVYAVERKGVLVHIPDEDTARTLYGNDWAQRVVDVPDGFFVNYDIDADRQVSSDTYPQGSLVKPADSNKIYYIDVDGKARHIKDESVFNSNRFQWRFVIEAHDNYELPEEGAQISSAEKNLIDPSQRAYDDDDGVGELLTVALSGNTPASATIPRQAVKVDFTKINFTASPDGPVTIQDLTFSRSGVGNSDNLGRAYLYDGDYDISGGKRVRDDKVVFDFIDYTIPAGQTKTLTLRVNVLDADGEHRFGISQASDIVTDGADVTGSFPIWGNTMNISGDVSVGSLDFEAKEVGGTVKVGDTQAIVAEFDLEASGENIAIESLRLRNRGTSNPGDLENFTLLADGDVVAEVASVDSDWLTFLLNDPYVIDDGDTEDFVVEADVIGGGTRNRTINYQLDRTDDILGKGTKYGFYVPVTANIGDYSGFDPIEIQVGDLSIKEANDNPSAREVVRGQKGVTFLKAELKAEDQSLSITDFEIKLEGSDLMIGNLPALENIALYLDGRRVAGPDDIDELNTREEGAVTYIVYDEELDIDGTKILEIRADISDKVEQNWSYRMIFDKDGVLVIEDAQGDRIDDPAVSGSAIGNWVTIGGPEADLSKDGRFGNQDIVSGEEILAGQFILSAGDAEALTISRYAVELGQGSMSYVKNLRVNEERVISSPRSSEVFRVKEEIAAGNSKLVKVYLEIDDDFVGDYLQVKLSVEGEGKVSGDKFNESQLGQIMTIKEGSLRPLPDSGTPTSALMLAQSKDNYLGKWQFRAKNTGFNISKVGVTVYNDTPSGSSGNTAIINTSAVSSLNLGGVIDNFPINGLFEFNTDIRVDRGDRKIVDARADFNSIANIVGDDYQVELAITSFEYKADNQSRSRELVWGQIGGSGDWAYVDKANNNYYMGTEGRLVESGTPMGLLNTGELMEVYDARITVSTESGDSTRLQSETLIMDITVTNDGGSQGDAIVNSLSFTTNLVSSGATIDSLELRHDNNKVGDDSVASGTVVLDSRNTIAEGQSRTYSLVINVSGAIVSDDYITARLIDINWDDNNHYSKYNSWIDGSLVDRIPSRTYELER